MDSYVDHCLERRNSWVERKLHEGALSVTHWSGSPPGAWWLEVVNEAGTTWFVVHPKEIMDRVWTLHEMTCGPPKVRGVHQIARWERAHA